MSYIIAEIELTQPLPTLAIPEGDSGVALIVRRAGRLIGFLMHAFPAEGQLGSAEAGAPADGQLNLQQHEDPPLEPTSPAALAAPPSITVAICTKDNPRDLAACLARLLAVGGAEPEGPAEILVVDNAPSDSRTSELVAAMPGVR